MKSVIQVHWLLLVCVFTVSDGMLINRPWNHQHWCRTVQSPTFPFAYQKSESQTIELKGRVTSNLQDMRHECNTFGVESKCHRCEDILCGGQLEKTCNYQLQGVDWKKLPKNIPTVTDIPFAVNGAHRYDYQSGDHICLFLSGGKCIRPDKSDYSSCALRCWGKDSGTIATHAHEGNFSSTTLVRGDADAADAWSYPRQRGGVNTPQGQVKTHAGSGKMGFLDGTAEEAKFSFPQDVAVDKDKNVYVADSENHRIRRIDGITREVSTFAGDGVEGFDDGSTATASFSHPSGVAVYTRSTDGKLVVFVADTGNHRIRMILDGTVSCIGGRCGQGSATETIRESVATPQPGFADGPKETSRYHSPMGLAIDPATDMLYIADTGNHLIRRISPDGTSTTIAGNLEVSESTPGCPPPCKVGVRGFRDGSLTEAQFAFPVDITIGWQSTLLVVDDNRIRRVTHSSSSTIQSIESQDRVVTIAGLRPSGMMDGMGHEALFSKPTGIAMDVQGNVYVVSPVTCKLRRISRADVFAQRVSCNTRLVDVLRPSGCSSYDEPVDPLNRKATAAAANIYYNYGTRHHDHSEMGDEFQGRELKTCIGTPPVDRITSGDKAVTMRNSTTGNAVEYIREDTAVGTAVKVWCPPNCNLNTPSGVFGTGMYTDESRICAAGIHAGVIQHSSGGMAMLILERGINYMNASVNSGSTSFGVTSEDMPEDPSTKTRLFSTHVYTEYTVDVQTIAGAATALLEESCGDVDASPAQRAMLNGPSGVDVLPSTVLSPTTYLYIADTRNHKIRMATAICSKVCENGGFCSGPETCTCLNGWEGDDCTTPTCSSACGARRICVAPNVCACIPGFTGPGCDTATCVQTCENGGVCTQPDTCTCAEGWFDPNCTTPVCTQTCGNGGNCTAPSTCSCPSEWRGADCRLPVCIQTCANGGSCIGPNTCLCPAGWSGHDCSIPICSQGTFLPDPSTYKFATARPRFWESYVPCMWETWCNETGGFDCLQPNRKTEQAFVAFGPKGRHITGRVSATGGGCMEIEVGEDALTNYRYILSTNVTTGYFRYSPQSPYDENSVGHAWKPILESTVGHTPPWSFSIDRQVAWVEKRKITQGAYICANGGNCIAPDVCECAKGWIGFDCRTPVCEQGYFSASQASYIASDPPEAKHPQHPVSNPAYPMTIETISYSSYSSVQKMEGDTRYLEKSLQPQGGYACSMRSLTQWEKPLTNGPYGSPEYYFEHPNYYSRYMDQFVTRDGLYHTHWKDMFWPRLYELSDPKLDDTNKGWQRAGSWYRVHENRWQKGKCLLHFHRVCSGQTEFTNDLVTEPDLSFRSKVFYDHVRSNSSNRWLLFGGGECVDHVKRGCYNNGTCVAPNTCECGAGWRGNDCSIPICDQTCMNGGNCTLPNICTCEIGWTGTDCSIPLCAQECRNNGKCVAPDTCKCDQYPSLWRDGREAGGRPIFRQQNGDPQLTGYTGYDCSTPICVQAKEFLLNVPRDTTGFSKLRGHGKDGNAECSAERCPHFDEELISNDGKSFQSGCTVGNPLANHASSLSTAEQIRNLNDYSDHLNVNRTSDKFLCGVMVWEQGDYLQGRHALVNYKTYTKVNDEDWLESAGEAGEGVFACYNRGSCIKPDTCSCGDGYGGIDCNKPLCRFLQPDGKTITGCQHNSVCVEKDTCRCIQTPSILHNSFALAPKGKTGYTGTDCSIAICVQGFFDPMCNDEEAGTEGCYRCANGGRCVSPDLCQCAEGWTGYDCTTPVCTQVADENTIYNLFTSDEERVHQFELDPCGENGGRWGKEMVNGALIGQGNCTLPNLCTCLCRTRYDKLQCERDGVFCDMPWQDPFNRSVPAGYVYGTKNCYDGFQGLEDEQGRLNSCHMQIYVPSFYRRYTTSFITILSLSSVMMSIAWYYLRKNWKKRQLLAKQERRRSRKSSADEPLKPKHGAFEHN